MEEIRFSHPFVQKAAAVFIPLLFFSYLMGISMQFALNDPDLWWHLKTGEYIVDNWSLPDEDPFSYTTPRILDENQKAGLWAQWLGQVIFHLASRTGGLLGVGLMRNLLIILPMVILYIWLVRQKAGLLPSLAVVSLPALFFVIQLFYSFERPQGMSFSLSLIVVILLERLRSRSKEPGLEFSYVLLPVSTALWANIHAGFIIGNIIIIIYLVSEALKLIFRKVRGSGTDKIRPVFFAICFIAVIASFLNPNKSKLFFDYFIGMFRMVLTDVSRVVSGGEGGDWVRSVVLEYKPLYYFYTNLRYDWLIIYWIFTAVLYASLVIKYWLRRSFDLAEFLTVTFVALFANMYARGLMFSLAIMPFYLGKTVVEFKGYGTRGKALVKGLVSTMLVLFFAFCTYTFNRSPALLTPGKNPGWVTPWYPTRAVEFLKQNPIRPPMYNYYTWGGFLIWSLYPDYKVFIDGRALENWSSKTADAMLKAYPGWEKKFDVYNINFILIPPVFRESGHVIPLAINLAVDDKWKLVFIMNNSAIFVRDVPKNAEIIKKYNINKKRIYKEIIAVENIFLHSAPNHPVFNMSKANALFALGMYKEAKAIYSRFPSESVSQLRRLKVMGY